MRREARALGTLACGAGPAREATCVPATERSRAAQASPLAEPHACPSPRPAPPRASTSRSACGCTTSTGATPARRRCCSCTAAATTAATGTGSPSDAAPATGTSSRPTCAATATANGRKDGTYTMAGYIYDLAQLIHQLRRRPRHHHRPLAGRQHRAALRRPLSRERRQADRHRGARARRRRCWPSASPSRFPERMRAWIDEQRGLAGRLPRRYATDRGRLQAHAGGEQAPHARAGAPPHPARRQPERGRHLQLEVRQLRALLAALRHDRRPTSRRCGRASPARRCSSTAGELGLQPGRGRPRAALQERRDRRPSTAPATGCTTTASTTSSPWSADFSRSKGSAPLPWPSRIIAASARGDVTAPRLVGRATRQAAPMAAAAMAMPATTSTK